VIIDYHYRFSKNERTQRYEVYVADSKLIKTTLQEQLTHFI